MSRKPSQVIQMDEYRNRHAQAALDDVRASVRAKLAEPEMACYDPQDAVGARRHRIGTVLIGLAVVGAVGFLAWLMGGQ